MSGSPAGPVPSRAGSLTVVGTGIRPGLQTTPEARVSITGADRVFYLVNDPFAEGFVRGLAPAAESLADCYREGEARDLAYAAMVERILGPLREGATVCAAFYGHPGVFVRPAHEALRRAAAEGHAAVMLPGISALDALLADLGIEPALHGLQSFEAGDFLDSARRFDSRTPLVLWQIGAVGTRVFRPDGAPDREGLARLATELGSHYGARHEVVVYEATELPVGGPSIVRCALDSLADAEVTARSTLYVPPAD